MFDPTLLRIWIFQHSQQYLKKFPSIVYFALFTSPKSKYFNWYHRMEKTLVEILNSFSSQTNAFQCWEHNEIWHVMIWNRISCPDDTGSLMTWYEWHIITKVTWWYRWNMMMFEMIWNSQFMNQLSWWHRFPSDEYTKPPRKPFHAVDHSWPVINKKHAIINKHI